MPRLKGHEVEYPYTARHLAEAVARNDEIEGEE